MIRAPSDPNVGYPYNHQDIFAAGLGAKSGYAISHLNFGRHAQPWMDFIKAASVAFGFNV
eukprot:8890853-Lingulodinium_polyedra.AAC.1